MYLKILCAPDSFKGSLTAEQVAEAMKEGIKKGAPQAEVKSYPLSDGGEGLLEALVRSTGGSIHKTIVSDPLGRLIETEYGVLGDGVTGVVEMARASGLLLLSKNEKNPTETSTYGTGELILDLLDKGCKKIVIGIGGSATNDGGLGMVRALGGKLYNLNREALQGRGNDLIELSEIDLSGLDSRIQNVEFVTACDVDNPLTGEQGAAHVFAPQKGADQEMVKFLDKGLKNYVNVINKTLGINVDREPGSGAAGGLGAGIMAFLNGKLVPGIELVLDTIKFEDHIKSANLIITGEGKLDRQTAYGKVPVGVGKLAKKKGVPVVAIAGTIGEGTEILHAQGLIAYFSIAKGPSFEESLFENASSLITDVSEQIIRLYTVR